MTSKLRLLLLLSAAYHSKIQLRMFIGQANYKSQLPNLTSQANDNCQLPNLTSHAKCTLPKHKPNFRVLLHYPKAQANFSGVSSASESASIFFTRYFTMQNIASRLFIFYLLFSILSSFFFFRRSWGDALRAILLYFKLTIFTTASHGTTAATETLMTSKLRLLLLLSAAYHSKIQLRMFILQANYKSQLPNLTSQANDNCQLPNLTSQAKCTVPKHKPKRKLTILKRKLTSRAFLRHRKAQVFVFRRYIASRLFLFYLLFSILSSFFFFRRSWGDALRAEIGPQVLCASALCKLLCASCSAQVALSKC